MTLRDSQAKERHDLLKEWRKQFAKQNDIPAFMVFSNKTLIDLANKNPQTLDELGQVYGFGAVKVDQLGESLLEALQ